jgi:hypothetical protein
VRAVGEGRGANRRTALARTLAVSIVLATGCSPTAVWSEDQAPVRVIGLDIANRIVHGPDVIPGRPVGSIKVVRGDDVVLRWTSDQSMTLHLHGYNIEAAVAAGNETDMRFRARATGRFAIETHGTGNDRRSHKTLLYLEVHPR